MNALIDLCVSRSRAVMVALAVLLFAGGAAPTAALPKEAQPDVDFPFISVEVLLDGVAAEDSERLLVRPLEQQLRNIEGLKEMVASATENRASVTLEFGPEVDVDAGADRRAGARRPGQGGTARGRPRTHRQRSEVLPVRSDAGDQPGRQRARTDA